MWKTRDNIDHYPRPLSPGCFYFIFQYVILNVLSNALSGPEHCSGGLGFETWCSMILFGSRKIRVKCHVERKCVLDASHALFAALFLSWPTLNVKQPKALVSSEGWVFLKTEWLGVRQEGQCNSPGRSREGWSVGLLHRCITQLSSWKHVTLLCKLRIQAAGMSASIRHRNLKKIHYLGENRRN